MKRSCFGLALVLAILAASTSGLFAQRHVHVPAGYGTLQAVLSADSLNRVADTSTVYIVHRGGPDSVYIMTSTLTNWGAMTLRIESVGAGEMPRFVWATKTDGSSYSPLISAKAGLSLKGVFIDGANTLKVWVDRMIRIQANGVTLRFDSVYASKTTQSFIRVDNGPAKIFLKNCRVSNCLSDWANARGIDNRGLTIDTLEMMNCTFFRLGQRAYRDGGGILNYGYFNHNTFLDMGSAALSLGSAKEIVFKNNLIVNCGFLGEGPTGIGRIIGLTPLPSGQSVWAGYNVFYADTAGLHAAYPDSVHFTPWFADTINTFMSAAGLTATNISSPVTFVTPPSAVGDSAIAVDSVAKWYYLNLPASGTNAWPLHVNNFQLVNLAFNTSAPAYTWGLDGKPAGAAEWFGITVGVAIPGGEAIPTGYTLLQNYPNPFNPSTRISYMIPTASDVRLEVFNMIGQSVRLLVNTHEGAGSHTVEWNGRDNAGRVLPSGVYLYRLQAGGMTFVKRMLLIK